MKIALFQFSLFGINTYVIYDEVSREAYIIDPGMSNSYEEDAIINFINDNHLILKGIVNTHLHIDHVAGNEFIINKYKVPVIAHKNEERLGKLIEQQGDLFGLSKKFKNVDIDIFVEPGDKLKLGNNELLIINVSGHSPGGIAIYSPKDNFVIVGDALFERSIGRTDLYGGNITELLSNIKENLFTLPENTVVYPGHGPATTIKEEKNNNPFF